MDWNPQGRAVTAPVSLADGRAGMVVVVGPRDNAKGAVIVAPKDGVKGGDKLAFAQGAALLKQTDAIEILVMQERLHGNSGLKPPPELAG